MSVKVMNYSYFLKIISYINTYISVTYTESTVRNVKPQGNHNTLFDALGNLYTVRNVKPQGNHNAAYRSIELISTVRNVKPQGNHNSAISLGHSQSLLVILYCKVITTKETEKSILRELLVTLYRKVIQLVRNRPL